MAESISIDTLRTICAEVPEARVIVVDCCEPKDGFQLMLAAEPVHYVLKNVPAEQLADALREIRTEDQTKFESNCSPSLEDGKQSVDKRTVVVLKVAD